MQSKLRNNELISIDLLTIILPFTQILKSSNFAGPFKLSALETLQTFMKSNLFISPSSNNLNLSITDLEHQEHVLHSAISEMVEVVSTCKFIQTDNQGDELVQLQILKTLYFTVLYIPKFVLFDCCWRTLQFFLKTLSSTGKRSIYIRSQLTLYFSWCALIFDPSITRARGDPAQSSCNAPSAFFPRLSQRAVSIDCGAEINPARQFPFIFVTPC